MVLDLSSDYLVMDGREAVTLDGGAVANAIRLEQKTAEGAPAGGKYVHTNVNFQLPTDPVIAPVVGSVLVAGGVTFAVLAVRRPILGDYWGLTCRALAVDDELITLFVAVHTTTAGGSKRTTHPTAHLTFVDIPGRIQPVRADLEEHGGQRGFRKRYDIYVSAELPTVRRGDVVKDSGLNVYTIDGWTNRKRIDEYSVLHCSTPPGT
jgi:hypothetical protein